MVTIAEQLKRVKRNRGLSTKDLERLTGVREDILLTIESSTFQGEISTLNRISKALNITFYIGDTSI